MHRYLYATLLIVSLTQSSLMVAMSNQSANADNQILQYQLNTLPYEIFKHILSALPHTTTPKLFFTPVPYGDGICQMISLSIYLDWQVLEQLKLVSKLIQKIVINFENNYMWQNFISQYKIKNINTAYIIPKKKHDRFFILKNPQPFNHLNHRIKQCTEASCKFINEIALYYAAATNKVWVIKKLAKIGIDLNKLIKQENRVSIENYMEKTESPLHCAVRCGSDDAFNTLITCGTSINTLTQPSGYTVLHYAIKYNQLQYIPQLQTLANIPNNQTYTPLQWALATDCKNFNVKKSVQDLVLIGADTNQKYNQWKYIGKAPLQIAIFDFPCVVSELLNGNTDVNIKDSDGNTPLHYAAYFKRESNLKQLLNKGANLSIKNAQGKTPLDFAQEAKFEKGIALLSAGNNVI